MTGLKLLKKEIDSLCLSNIGVNFSVICFITILIIFLLGTISFITKEELYQKVKSINKDGPKANGLEDYYEIISIKRLTASKKFNNLAKRDNLNADFEVEYQLLSCAIDNRDTKLLSQLRLRPNILDAKALYYYKPGSATPEEKILSS